MPEHVPVQDEGGREGEKERGWMLRERKKKNAHYLVITVEHEIRKSWLACVPLERVTFGKFLQLDYPGLYFQ